MNRLLVSALVLSSALVAPALAFAQNDAPVTRAQVRAELIQLESAGYTPGGDDANYPQDILAAEARVAAQHNPSVTAYGSSDAGMSASGSSDSSGAHTAMDANLKPIYSGQ